MDAPLPRQPWQGAQVVAKAALVMKNKILPWPAMALPSNIGHPQKHIFCGNSRGSMGVQTIEW